MDSDSRGVLSKNTGNLFLNKTSAGKAISPPSIENELPHMDRPAGKGFGRFPAAYQALLIAVLAVAGSYSILPTIIFMSRIWLNDPLRAIGVFFPPLALAGTIAAWRRLGWSMNGSIWGLPLIALSIFLSRANTSLILVFRIHERSEPVLHTGAVMFLYASGAVLLFGGPRLLRAAIAPLCLLLFVNPVPAFFNSLVDLPLQYLSANTARHFAHLIGLQPTGEQLRMMFSPTFGMMIVPGCNGVRGSVTLGYLALIFGYMRHLRGRKLALTTLAALLMGYALNLLRLCTLVIYYRVGLSVVSIQQYGAGIDYAIGGTLFLLATLGIGLFIRWIEPEPQTAENSTRNSVHKAIPVSYATAVRTVCFLILTLVFIVPALSKGNSFHVRQPSEQDVLASFPSRVGPYRLTRTYTERDNTGTIQFALADYSAPANGNDPAKNLKLGIHVGVGMHLVAYSRFAQGIRPSWTGSIAVVDANAQPPLKVHFVTTLFDDGSNREFNAESVCYENGCSASIDSNRSRLFFSLPALSDLLFASNGNRISILVREDRPDSEGKPTATQQSEFEADTRQFTEQLDLRELLHQEGTPI